MYQAETDASRNKQQEDGIFMLKQIVSENKLLLYSYDKR